MHTGLELMFMGVTQSNSGFFSTPGFLVFSVGKRESGGGRREVGKKGIEKERKDWRTIEKDQRHDKKEF